MITRIHKCLTGKDHSLYNPKRMVLYNVVRHDLRKEWGIGVLEFLLLDLINLWSNNIQYGGWCIASRAKLADTLGTTDRHVARMLKSLSEDGSGLLDVNNETRFLRTTDKFRMAMMGGGDQMSPLTDGRGRGDNRSGEGVTIGRGRGDNRSPNNTIYNILLDYDLYYYKGAKKFFSGLRLIFPKGKGKKSHPPVARAPLPWSSPEFAAKWAEWRQYKKDQHRFTYKNEKSESRALAMLYELSNGDEATAIEIIERSMNQNWQGLFRLQPNYQKQPTNAIPHQRSHTGENTEWTGFGSLR